MCFPKKRVEEKPLVGAPAQSVQEPEPSKENDLQQNAEEVEPLNKSADQPERLFDDEVEALKNEKVGEEEPSG
jgi:hypothetical protein